MARSDKIEFTERDLKQLETMAGLGLSVKQMGSILGVSKATMDRRIAENNNDNPIYEALERGRAVASYNIVQTAYEVAVKNKNTTMLIFWLKCREGWRENPDLTVTGDSSKGFTLKYSVNED